MVDTKISDIIRPTEDEETSIMKAAFDEMLLCPITNGQRIAYSHCSLRHNGYDLIVTECCDDALKLTSSKEGEQETVETDEMIELCSDFSLYDDSDNDAVHDYDTPKVEML